jgi:hypothetical protein
MGRPNPGCLTIVEPLTGTLEDEAVNDLNGITSLHFTIQFSLLDAAKKQENTVGINISKGHDRVALDCVYISADNTGPPCIGMHINGANYDTSTMTSYKHVDNMKPLDFTVDWSADGTVTIRGGGDDPRSYKLANAPDKLYVQADSCEVQYKNPTPAAPAQ